LRVCWKLGPKRSGKLPLNEDTDGLSTKSGEKRRAECTRKLYSAKRFEI
jgi:hypothetical protein